MTLDRDQIDGWADLGPGINVLGGLIGGSVALAMGILYAFQVVNIELDPSKKQTIALADKIHKGAVAFLTAEYKALSVFVLCLYVILSIIVNWQTGITFIFGAILSATSGWIGMQIATKANVRTTLACQGDDGLNNGLIVAFKSGSVMALMTVGTGLLGLSILYLIFYDEDRDDAWKNLSGFAFGGSSIALFARVGGGIYTKAADVGADLVGKVEEELNEDSPDNPATIADNVGDNVGDVAGMGADLFESFVGSLIAASTIGADELGHSGVAFPFFIAGFGALCSIGGTFMVRAHPDPNASSHEVLEILLDTIRKAIIASSVATALVGLIVVGICFGFNDGLGTKIWVCVIIGLIAGNCIGYFTEVATSYTYAPTQSIAKKSDTGPATVMIQGLGVGMLSTVPPVLFIVITMLACYELAEFYGIAIAAVGMLSTLGVTLATDAFGPVADNAGGIAEMAPDDEIDDQVRETTDALDALGNTTAATGKGFAIGSAVLTALALMNAFAEESGLIIDLGGSKVNASVTSLLEPVVLPGILLGALLPFVFAALTMLSVGEAAESIMWECRDQMNKKFFDGTPLAPEKCIAISTVSSLKEMVAPGALAIFMPVIVGTLLGTPGLMGLLAGSISAGFLLAVMMSNAGGAWDNAKKYVEKDNLGEGKGKRSENHKAVVVGDTVGDPFKDTSGPALNILIKLMSIISLVLARELSNEPWDQWGWALGVSLFLLIGGYFFFKYIGSAALHDFDAILAQSRKRKQQNGSQQSGSQEEQKEEMKEVDLDNARAVIVEPEPMSPNSGAATNTSDVVVQEEEAKENGDANNTAAAEGDGDSSDSSSSSSSSSSDEDK